MVPWNRCTMRWLLVTGCDVLAFRSSKLPPYQLSFARGRALNSFITPKSSSLWCSRKFDHPPGSSRPLTRHQGQTYLCNSCLGYLCWFLARILFFDELLYMRQGLVVWALYFVLVVEYLTCINSVVAIWFLEIIEDPLRTFLSIAIGVIIIGSFLALDLHLVTSEGYVQCPEKNRGYFTV